MKLKYQVYGDRHCPSCESNMLVTYTFPIGVTFKQIEYWKVSKVETLKQKATSITASCIDCDYKEELK
jgi:hypothetical protein